MNNALTSENIRETLADMTDPESGRLLSDLGQIGDATANEKKITLDVALTTHSAILWRQTQGRIEERLRTAFPNIPDIQITVRPHERPPTKIGQVGLQAKSVIAVGSGKGGVGKSTIAVSLAIGLARAGSKVGILDADVYGPSIPHLVGLEGRPAIEEGKIIPPQLNPGQPNQELPPGLSVKTMPIMSMGFLVPSDEAVIWRGPMLHGAITQMLRDTDWGQLDYLIIDMPPGTGDIALTLSQVLPLSGALVVCTPQDVALLDATKAIAMFQKVNIPVLGMVENMSFFLCPDNNKRYEIFGTGGAKRTARELEIPFLGEVPLQIPIREHGDAGNSAANYDDPQTQPYFNAICNNLVTGLATRNASAPPMPSLPTL